MYECTNQVNQSKIINVLSCIISSEQIRLVNKTKGDNAKFALALAFQSQK